MVPGGLNVNVATVAVGDLANLRHHVDFSRVPHFVRTHAQGEGGALGFHVEHDEFFRVAHAHRADDPQAQGTGTGHHHDVVEIHIRPFRCVQRAGQRFDQDGFVRGNRVRDFVDDAFLGEDHVLGHGALDVVLETVQVVFLAHPVLAVVAEAAAPARHDLLGNHPVADLHPTLFCAWAEGDHAAHEFVAGNHRRLHVTRLLSIAPERWSTAISLDVAHADAAQLDLGQDLVGPGRRYIDGLQAIVFGAMADHGLHGFRNDG